jgi:uncharacterized cupin superfamily protein
MNGLLSAQGIHCKVISNVDRIASEQLVDWGEQPDCIDGPSLSRGILLHKGPDNKPESGFWECTPGSWPLSIPRDEFCHFIQGEATYTSDGGEVIDVSAGTCVHFKAGWTGHCQVKATLRNVYMLTA